MPPTQPSGPKLQSTLERNPRVAIQRGLRRLRWNCLRNAIQDKLAASRLRLAMVILFSLIFWGGLYFLFLDGFMFLNRQLIGRPLVEGLFGLFFTSLFVMLLFSTGIISYAGLFVSSEAAFLLSQPIPPDRVFAYKFQEAMFFSCWGFLLLGSPMMIAFGVACGAPWIFYPLALGYFVSFALLSGAIGALTSLWVTCYLPRRKREMLLFLAMVVVVALAWWGLRVRHNLHGPVLSQAWLNALARSLRLSNLPLLPSHWISTGLLAGATSGGGLESLFYLLVLQSNGLAAYLVCAASFRRLYRSAFSRVNSAAPARRRAKSWLPRLVDAALRPLPPTVRVLIVKDVRTFFRDPVQWTQVLIFLGLFALYSLNLGRMTYYTSSPYWRNMIGFFNLSVIGFLMAAFTSRFIFPLMSLEGQKLWILGLCPIPRGTILWGKFTFACGGALSVTLSLTLLSAAVLKLEPLLLALQLAVVVVLCFGVSGIAVGLGARFPDLREPDPSKIAAGFGGTLNLVASMLFIALVIVAMAMPCHLYSVTLSLAQQGAGLPVDRIVSGISLEQFRFWLGISIAATLAIGIAATIVPMRLGVRAFERMEY
jgi:ABC-2 type transport system permease protein